MGQITEAFAKSMLKHSQAGEHSPLTVWEEEQLARAFLRTSAIVKWLEENRPDVFSRGLWDAIKAADA